MADLQIDRHQLRAAIRSMGSVYVFQMLDDAIMLFLKASLRKLIKDYPNPAELCPDSAEKSLLADVKAFQEASLSRRYYKDFVVNSKNCTEKSGGTLAWIADCRLLNRCVAETAKWDAAEVRQAFEIIFGLLDHIDGGEDDVVFFADEGGSWQVGVDWEKVLPAWFRVLSATADPVEYALRVDAVLNHHYPYGRVKMLAVSRRSATPGSAKIVRPKQQPEAVQ